MPQQIEVQHFHCQPPLDENVSRETARDECTDLTGHPALLQENSISADNIPALCLNDYPTSNRPKQMVSSFRKGSLKERTIYIDSNMSSQTDSPIRSSLSDDSGEIIATKQTHPPREQETISREQLSADKFQHCQPPSREDTTEQMAEDDCFDHIPQSFYFSEAKGKAQVPFLDHEVIECDCNGREYTIEEHDITLKIPEGAVGVDEKIHFEIGVAMYGPFNFPENTQPISPILWLCVLEEDVELKRPFQIILPHFLIGLTKDRVIHHQAGFAKASHNHFVFHNQQVYYDFDPCEAKTLFASSGRRGYGVISLSHCCFYCLLAKQTPELAMDAGYCLVRIETLFAPQIKEITFCASYFLDTCLKVYYYGLLPSCTSLTLCCRV